MTGRRELTTINVQPGLNEFFLRTKKKMSPRFVFPLVLILLLVYVGLLSQRNFQCRAAFKKTVTLEYQYFYLGITVRTSPLLLETNQKVLT